MNQRPMPGVIKVFKMQYLERHLALSNYLFRFNRTLTIYTFITICQNKVFGLREGIRKGMRSKNGGIHPAMIPTTLGAKCPGVTLGSSPHSGTWPFFPCCRCQQFFSPLVAPASSLSAEAVKLRGFGYGVFCGCLRNCWPISPEMAPRHVSLSARLSSRGLLWPRP